MEINIDNTKWYDRIWAAFIFFTRLPFWRLHEPPQACYRTVVEHWPLTGWLTGGAMAAIIFFGSMVFPYYVAVLMGIVVRILITGALHEDGLCDFLDGFGGGGNDRARILAIMKDSHIGTYGVLGIILYLALLFACLFSFQRFVIPTDADASLPLFTALAVFAGDSYSKMLSAQIIMFLPYARTEDTAKNHTVYRKMSIPAGIFLFVQGMLPLVPLFYFSRDYVPLRWDLMIFMPCIVMYFLYYMMLRKLRGYTGDCCGALCLLIELSFYLTLTAQLY